MAEEHIRNDFAQAYDQTYVRIGTEEIYVVDYVVSVEPIVDPRTVDFEVILKNCGLKNFREIHILPGFPEPKFVNLGYCCYFFNRKSDRQFKKGINTSNAEIRSLDLASPIMQCADIKVRSSNDRGLACLGAKSYPMTIQTIKEVCNPTYPSFRKAISLLKNTERPSVAFCNRLAMSVSMNSDNFLLWLENVPIGEVDTKKDLMIFLFDGFLKQETSDIFKRFTNEYIQIKVKE